MSSSQEAVDVEETVQLFAGAQSDVEDCADIAGQDMHSAGHGADLSVDPNGKENASSHRLFKTLCLYVSFGTMGILSPLVGTTLVHMEQLYDSDTATMSLTFTVSCFGYLIGAIACGFLLDRISHDLLLSLSSGVMAVSTVVAPFFSTLPLFIAALFIQAHSMGFVDASVQSYSIRLWTGHRCKEPVVQAAHAVWALGAAVGPLVIAEFLVELPTEITAAVNFTSISSPVLDATESYSVSKSEISVVRYAYVTLGAIAFSASVLYAVTFALDRLVEHSADYQRLPLSQQNSHKEDDAEFGHKKHAENQRREKLTTLIFLALIALFYYVYVCVARTTVDYFPTFAIKFLRWPVKNTSLLESLYFGAHSLGRFLGVPLSFVLRPRTMIVINLLLTLIASVILLPVKIIPELLWASSALAGIGSATTFATALLWVSELIPIDGRVASVVVASGSVGGIVQPQIVGRLFQVPAVGGPMSLVYVSVTAALIHIASFTCMLLFAARYLRDSETKYR